MGEPTNAVLSRGLLCAGCREVYLLDGHTIGASVGSACDCGRDDAVFVRAVVLDADAHAEERKAVRDWLRASDACDRAICGWQMNHHGHDVALGAQKAENKARARVKALMGEDA